MLDRLAGIAKFNGMTRVANPTMAANDRVDLTRWCRSRLSFRLTAVRPRINRQRNRWLTQHIAAPVRITGIVCEASLDDSRSTITGTATTPW